MHRRFREALNNAVGQSKYIIAVFVDIRGFSAFSQFRESPDTAMYIKKIYMRLIDDYFTSASFYKPTGDGLFITVPYSEATLREVSCATIKICLRCHREFANICDGDDMINFDVPKSIGIGIAKGTACCIKSGDNVLDYSGRVINLAARLTKIARPSGIVIDGDFGAGLFPESERKFFEESNVYLRSIAEDTPIKVYILKDAVNIPPENKQPLAEERWEVIYRESSVREMLTLAGAYCIELKAPLKRPDAFEVILNYPKMVDGKALSSLFSYSKLSDCWYGKYEGRPCIYINSEQIKSKLGDIPPHLKAKISVSYVPKPSLP